MDTPIETILTTAETAEVLHTPIGTLRWWRHTGTGPKSFKLGAKRVFYKKSDVVEWLEAQYSKEA